MAPQNKWFAASPNTDYIYKALTDGTVTNLTGGKIPKMNAAQAAGLIGSWLIETGRKGLNNLDVVEKGSGRGRGLSQYTGVRRGPYDAAVAKARAAGKDPNSAQWQIEYFAQEYLNRDLIGWTQVFERMPQNLKSAGEYARYFTGSAAEGKGYFRPGVPHTDRRMEAAAEVFRYYSAPKPAPPAAQPQNKPAIQQGPLQRLLRKLGIKGKQQGFAIDKLQRNLGSIAATPNAGFAIFDSVSKGNSKKAWRSMSNSQKRAWSSVGGQLGIQVMAPNRTYSMPKGSNNSTTQSFGPKAVDLSINGVKPGDLGYGSRKSTGSFNRKSAGQVYYEANKNYFDKTGRYDQYGGKFGADATGRYSGTVRNLSGSGWTGGYSGLNIGGNYGSPSYSSGSVATGTGMGSIGTPSSRA